MKQTLIAALTIIGLAACNQNNSNTTTNPNPNPNPTQGSMNSTEQKMVGKWSLQKERYLLISSGTIVRDSTITVFTGNPYVEFQTTKHSLAGGGTVNANAKTYVDHASLETPGGAFHNIRGNNTINGAWYFDETSKTLSCGLVGVSSWSHISVSATDLIIAGQFPVGTQKDTLWFKKM